MSVEIISLGNFDYSDFCFTDNEQALVRYIIKYHITSYNITLNTDTRELVFYMNMTELSQDKATEIFITIFDLLEQQFFNNHLSNFNVCMLNHTFTFSRTIKEDITSLTVKNLVNWTVSIDNLSSLKSDLFDFYQKKQHFNTLLEKYPKKNIVKKSHKI